MEQINSLINPWAGLASLLGLVFAVVGFSMRMFKRYKAEKIKQQEKYDDIKRSINSLSGGATTISKRQDVYMYASETLGNSRHKEIQMRVKLVPIYIISFIVFCFSLGILLILKLSILFVVVLVIGNILILQSCISFINIQSQFSKLNESFYDGYMESVHDHIEKTILPKTSKNQHS